MKLIATAREVCGVFFGPTMVECCSRAQIPDDMKASRIRRFLLPEKQRYFICYCKTDYDTVLGQQVLFCLDGTINCSILNLH
jgi:hypothetical protein